MKADTSFENGLVAVLPNGVKRHYRACEWNDDDYVTIDSDGTCSIWSDYKLCEAGAPPRRTFRLPTGTEIRQWDEDYGNPLLFKVA